MRTTHPLSTRSITILNSLRKNEYAHTNSLIATPLLLMVGCGLLYIHKLDGGRRIKTAGEFCIIISILFAFETIKRYRKKKRRDQMGYSDLQHTVCEVLHHIELIHDRFIRYHFASSTLDLYIPIGPPRHLLAHNQQLLQAGSIPNTPVTLTYTEYEPGMNVLLDITYDHYRSHTSVLPMEDKDRKRLMNTANLVFSGIVAIIFFVAFFAAAVSRFNLRFILTSLTWPVVLVLLVPSLIYYYKKRGVMRTKNKIVMETSIIETVQIKIKHSKSYVTPVYSRFADGELTHYLDKKFSPGDKVVLQFREDKNKARGRLIDIVKL